MTGVEFLADDSTADDPPHPRPRRPWWLLGLLALVVAAAVVVLTRPSDQPEPTAAVPTPRFTFQPLATSSPPDRGATACRGLPLCTTSAEIPAGLRTVIRQYMPSATTLEVRSYVGRATTGGGRYLTGREINVGAGSVNVLISLHRRATPESAPSALVTAGAGTGSLVIRAKTAAFTVDLQYLAPETVPPALGQLRKLLRDPRLEML